MVLTLLLLLGGGPSTVFLGGNTVSSPCVLAPLGWCCLSSTSHPSLRVVLFTSHILGVGASFHMCRKKYIVFTLGVYVKMYTDKMYENI